MKEENKITFKPLEEIWELVSKFDIEKYGVVYLIERYGCDVVIPLYLVNLKKQHDHQNWPSASSALKEIFRQHKIPVNYLKIKGASFRTACFIMEEVGPHALVEVCDELKTEVLVTLMLIYSWRKNLSQSEIIANLNNCSIHVTET